MATNLRKYKFVGSASTRPGASSDDSAQKAQKTSASPNANPCAEGQQAERELDFAELKSELLLSIKQEIAGVLKEELKRALAEDFDAIKTQMQGIRDDITGYKEATQKEIEEVKATVKNLEGGMSIWSDEVVNLNTSVSGLKKEVADLRNKYDDLEGRMRRCNIRIVGIPEAPDSSTTKATRLQQGYSEKYCTRIKTSLSIAHTVV